jgi:hypothetical protein
MLAMFVCGFWSRRSLDGRARPETFSSVLEFAISQSGVNQSVANLECAAAKLVGGVTQQVDANSERDTEGSPDKQRGGFQVVHAVTRLRVSPNITSGLCTAFHSSLTPADKLGNGFLPESDAAMAELHERDFALPAPILERRWAHA